MHSAIYKKKCMLHIIYIHCTLHNFLLHVYESNKTIGMFNGKFADEGDNSVKNPSILYYNVEGDNRLSPSLWPLTIGSVLNKFYQPGSVIVFSIPEIILLFSEKNPIQVINILE